MRISWKRLFLSSHSSAWLSVLFWAFFLLVLLSTNLTNGKLLDYSRFFQVVTRSTLFPLFLLLLCWTLDPYLWVGTNGTVHLLGSFEQTWAQVLFLPSFLQTLPGCLPKLATGKSYLRSFFSISSTCQTKHPLWPLILKWWWWCFSPSSVWMILFSLFQLNFP